MDLIKINLDGQKAEKSYVAEFINNATTSPELIKQQIRVLQTNKRQGNAHTKTRADVSGGGKKPWRQKGTGRARVGSIRSPLWRGGGVIHGPKSKTWSLGFTKKMKNKAFEHVLAIYASKNNFMVLEGQENFEKPNTKMAAKIITNIEPKGSVIVLTDNSNAYLSFRNIKNVVVKSPKDVNILDILEKNAILTTEADIDILKGRIK